MTFTQYGNNSPQGAAFLASDIMPWEDYVIFRSDEDTSIAVYGTKCDGVTWYDCNVREVTRTNAGTGYTSYYVVDEYEAEEVTVVIDNPYYAYGNVIGVHYALPSSANITSMLVASVVVVCAVLSVFRTLWSFRKVAR